jgi:hypothetical protein
MAGYITICWGIGTGKIIKMENIISSIKRCIVMMHLRRR